VIGGLGVGWWGALIASLLIGLDHDISPNLTTSIMENFLIGWHFETRRRLG